MRLRRLVGLSEAIGTANLVGSVDRLPVPSGQFLNSAFLLTRQGISAKYDKIQLVPFGEYVPLGSLIGFVRSWAEFISDFAAGQTVAGFPLAGGPVGPGICAAGGFPQRFRGIAGGGAGLMWRACWNSLWRGFWVGGERAPPPIC